jgi:O-antigen/teichoic acid export membrane protein
MNSVNDPLIKNKYSLAEERTMGREQAAIKGSIVGILSQFITLVLKFIIRTYLIRVLGQEFIGLDSVIIDLVSMLSLSDLGISSAMLFKLYKPVISHDTNRIAELLSAYRIIFRGICVAIAVFGLIISCFLPWIIKGVSISWPVVYAAFYLQLTATVATYLVTEKRILLDADRMRHLSMSIDLIVYVIMGVLEIVALLIFHNYLAYLVVALCQPILALLLIQRLFKQKFPDIQIPKHFNRSDVIDLFHDAKEVFGNKIAGYVYSSTDNIVISVFMNTAIVGLLSNYRYIANALKSLVNSAMSAMQPLVGNFLNSNESHGRAFEILQRYTFLRYLMVGACIVPVITVGNDFVRIWTGSQHYVLSILVPLLMMIDFYCGAMAGPLGEYLLGLGYFKTSRQIAVVNALVNIVLSILCVLKWGYIGVLIGTAVSQVITWGLDVNALFKLIFTDKHDFVTEYVKRVLRYTLMITICVVLSGCAVRLIPEAYFLIRFGVGIVLSELLFGFVTIAAFRKTSDFQYVCAFIKRMFKLF